MLYTCVTLCSFLNFTTFNNLHTEKSKPKIDLRYNTYPYKQLSYLPFFVFFILFI
jgi:hypothetical protein